MDRWANGWMDRWTDQGTNKVDPIGREHFGWKGSHKLPRHPKPKPGTCRKNISDLLSLIGMNILAKWLPWLMFAQDVRGKFRGCQ